MQKEKLIVSLVLFGLGVGILLRGPFELFVIFVCVLFVAEIVSFFVITVLRRNFQWLHE